MAGPGWALLRGCRGGNDRYPDGNGGAAKIDHGELSLRNLRTLGNLHTLMAIMSSGMIVRRKCRKDGCPQLEFSGLAGPARPAERRARPGGQH
jgi:hypothetical protein